MESSRAYYMSHILLRNEIYGNWAKFIEALKAGPDEMQTYLANMWNDIDAKYFKEGVVIRDIDRKVTKQDFSISIENINDVLTVFIIFPELDSYMAQARVVAIALCEKYPRYITMEIWTEQEILMNQKLKEGYPLGYTVGEWQLKEQGFEHINYGRLPDATMECFVSFIGNTLLKQDKE